MPKVIFTANLRRHVNIFVSEDRGESWQHIDAHLAAITGVTFQG